MKTEGSRLLQAALDCGSWSQTKVAAALEPPVTRQAVSYWADGSWQPEPKRMAQLEDLLGIPMRAWTRSRAEKKTGTGG
jgi:ribosome-binding protein aMBF1 (putative translation factor)